MRNELKEVINNTSTQQQTKQQQYQQTLLFCFIARYVGRGLVDVEADVIERTLHFLLKPLPTVCLKLPS
jgi:hypothetical protein